MICRAPRCFRHPPLVDSRPRDPTQRAPLTEKFARVEIPAAPPANDRALIESRPALLEYHPAPVAKPAALIVRLLALMTF